MNEAKLHFKIADEMGVPSTQVTATVRLLDEGSTVPFISRYRREVTGSLDEVQIAHIRDEIERLRQLESRRETILNSIEGQGKLTPELETQIRDAETLSRLEDLYLPYKPKRRTRATIAREKGLEPLALLIMEQKMNDLDGAAAGFVSEEKHVLDKDEALSGARDIIAEMISEDAVVRDLVRDLYQRTAIVKSRVIS